MIPENEQYDDQSFYHLAKCCRYVSGKYGNDDAALWTNSDYVKLSSIVFHKTNVKISPSTLKRIFGKLKTPERYYPQKATRDALAQYAGFEDWETFVHIHPRLLKNEDIKAVEPNTTIFEDPEAVKKEIRRKSNWLLLVLILAGILAIAIWQFFEKDNAQPMNLKAIKLICTNPIGANPHSAEFIIQVPKNFVGDTTAFTINFDDAKTEKKELANAVFTNYYEISGRYYPVLKYKNIAVDTVSVYLESNGWTATAVMEHDTTRVYPVNSNLFKNEGLTVNSSELFQAGVDTNRTFFVHFVNTKATNISGDNFELIADVTASQPRPGVRCSQVAIEVFGEKSKDEVVLIKPGCVSWASLRFSEIYKYGGTADLRPLGADLSQGGVVKLHVVDKKVSLFVNDKVIYKTEYHFPLEKIYGIEISFSGIGNINDLVLKDLNTKEVLNEGFQETMVKQ